MADQEHTSRLFRPLKIGQALLLHRLVMAPLTRYRSSATHVPLPELVPEYYAQRASTPGTLIITEATFISPRAAGYHNAPGIWTPEQIAGWKTVTAAVHDKKSFIYLQLWALGRAAKPDILAEDKGLDVVSASDIPMPDEGAAKPRSLSTDEIAAYITDYQQAARNAIEAGFDGVEVHAANGYLIDQFTQDVSNKRTDRYGGSIENRSRFALEVTRACVEAIGADRVGIRLSPYNSFQGMRMTDPAPQFSHLIHGLAEMKLAYLHLVRLASRTDLEERETLEFAHKAWGRVSPILLAGAFTPESAFHAADQQHADEDVAVVFGRHFISNPDLPFRIQRGLELSPYDRDTFYTPMQRKGYTDYPFSKEFEEMAAKA